MKRQTQNMLYHLLPVVFWLSAIVGSILTYRHLSGYIVMLIALLAVHIIHRIPRRAESVEQSFQIALLLGIASYWLPTVIFLIPPIWLYLIYQNIFSLRSFLATLIMIAVRPTGVVIGEHGEYTFPAVLYGIWALKGFGMALVHNCSFPMVVELCTSKKIGKFTGYYYAASMSAQTVTPVLLGFIFMQTRAWGVLPVYASVLTALSALVFITLVKNIRIKKVATVSGLEAFAEDE